MTVLSLSSPSIPATEVDLFAIEPFPFDAAYERSMRADLRGVIVPVVSLPDLIASSGAQVDRKTWKTCASSKRSRGRTTEMSAPTQDQGYERHQREQRRAWLRLTHLQRLQWLEQAKQFAARAIEAAKKRAGPKR